MLLWWRRNICFQENIGPLSKLNQLRLQCATKSIEWCILRKVIVGLHLCIYQLNIPIKVVKVLQRRNTAECFRQAVGLALTKLCIFLLYVSLIIFFCHCIVFLNIFYFSMVLRLFDVLFMNSLYLYLN